LKRSIQATLRTANCFIKMNDWGASLDSRTSGYLANLHPVHHNRDTIHRDVREFLRSSMMDDADESNLPDFKVVPSSANESHSNKRVSSRFLAITCKNSDDALVICKKLVSAYSTLPTPIDQNLGSFIPANAKYTDLEIFRKLIRRQNQFLANHRNIPMDGLDEKIMSASTGNGKDLEDEIPRRSH
jgi:hypothetical protein